MADWQELGAVEGHHAVLDIKAGRGALRRALKAGEKVQVTITGVITEEHGSDDGISQEFSVAVEIIETEMLEEEVTDG